MTVASDERNEAAPDNDPAHATPINDSRVISDVTPDNTCKPGARYAQDQTPGVGLSATLRALVEKGEITAEEAAMFEQRADAMKAAQAARITAAIESRTVSEAKSVLSSQEFAKLRAAYEAGQETTVTIGGRTIQYDPNIPPQYAGTTNFNNNGFSMSPVAFKSPQDTQATVLHELYRLNTTEAGSTGIHSGESSLVEGDTAREFANKIVRSGVMDK